MMMPSNPELVFIAAGNGEVPFVRLRAYVSAALEQGMFGAMKVVFQGRGLDYQPMEATRFVDRVSRSEYAGYVDRANVFICHAGAGSILDACTAGHLPVVVPRDPANGEVVDSHQIELARRLELGGSVLVGWDEGSFLDCVRKSVATGRLADRSIGRLLASDIANVIRGLVR